MAYGQPLPDHEIRVVDETNRELGERCEGRLEFRGPSTTRGYFRNEAKTRALFHDGWLDSADRAYMAGGEVFITGRVKDIIIRAGRHLYPQEIEEAVADIPGIRKGGVAVFGVTDQASGTERVVVLAETQKPIQQRARRCRPAPTRSRPTLRAHRQTKSCSHHRAPCRRRQAARSAVARPRHFTRAAISVRYNRLCGGSCYAWGYRGQGHKSGALRDC